MTALPYLFAILVTAYLTPYVFYLMSYAILKLREHPACPTVREKYQPFITVVVPTYNEEDKIRQKLENLIDQDYPLDKMEVLVVDASTDNTPLIVMEYSQKYPNIRVLKEEKRRGLASALNFAYSQARGEVVIKSDCDILLARDSIKRIVSHFSDPSIGAVSGKQKLLTKNQQEEGYRNLVDIKRIVENHIDSVYLMEPFSAFRRNLIEAIDPKSVADDAELGIKIRRKGYRVIFDPCAVFYESMPSSMAKRIKIKSRRAQGHIRLMLSNTGLLFNPRYGKYGMLIFPLNFFMIVISPWIMLLLGILFVMTSYLVWGVLGSLATISVIGILLTSLATGRPKFLTGYMEAQLSLILGWIKLLTRGPEYIWEKVRD